ncbi:hypothetical protein BOTCAL_0202g00190 [Botryotinia calthae]|uniref:MYND-type domain-containing protein n=1 Tax=Botryotinia calthae TaxID=38488 RepID=A0A4Y8CZG5_9HELO|nr:hypothetical protein BOTCAL_0202g00190 [Botryotinia calthae]
MASIADTDASPPPPALTCTICNLPAKDCTRCKSAAYCSSGCQTLDWPLHKTLCKKITTMSPRPSPTHKLGILFSPDSEKPELVWVDYKQIEIPGVEGQFELPDVDRFLTYGSGDSYDSEQLLIEPQRIMRARNIKHTLAVSMRDNFGSDGSKMTQSASSITAGKMKHAWKGPLIVVAMEGQSVPQSRTLKIGGTYISFGTYTIFQRSTDITLRDFRVIHDYFLAYPDEAESKLKLNRGASSR